MGVIGSGGVESLREIVTENQLVVPTIQSIEKTVKKEEKLSASLEWDSDLDIVIIRVLRGEKVMFQVPPDAIIEMAKYLRRNFLKGILVNRTV